jgi:hypothetical protein
LTRLDAKLFVENGARAWSAEVPVSCHATLDSRAI